jgi:translation initiation factor 1
MSDENSKLVYSTEQAIPRLPRHLRNDEKAKNKPVEKVLPTSLRPSQQKATVRLDRKGRGGKSVTVIEGLRMPQKEREALLKQLKAKLGTGGTVKGTCLEIQQAAQKRPSAAFPLPTAGPSSLRRTSKYASLLRGSGALHLGILEQPAENDFFSNLPGRPLRCGHNGVGDAGLPNETFRRLRGRGYWVSCVGRGFSLRPSVPDGRRPGESLCQVARRHQRSHSLPHSQRAFGGRRYGRPFHGIGSAP